MTTLLHLDSSGKGSQSVTKPLTSYFLEQWRKANTSGKVISRDLSASNLQFVSPELVGAFYTPDEHRSPAQELLLKQSDELIAELLEADEYVFGVPMYNFSVPAVFKAYIDLIVRVGKTFAYQAEGPKGLLQNKKLTVITASGGDYGTDQTKNLDFVEPYTRVIIGFLGVHDITFIKAHGHDPETIQQTSEAAKQQIVSLFASRVG